MLWEKYYLNFVKGIHQALGQAAGELRHASDETVLVRNQLKEYANDPEPHILAGLGERRFVDPLDELHHKHIIERLAIATSLLNKRLDELEGELSVHFPGIRDSLAQEGRKLGLIVQSNEGILLQAKSFLIKLTKSSIPRTIVLINQAVNMKGEMRELCGG